MARRRKVRLTSGRVPGKGDHHSAPHQWGGIRIRSRERAPIVWNDDQDFPTRFYDRLHGLGFGSYSAYLKGKHWLELKRRFWKNCDRKRCFVCDAWSCLQLHHIRYDNLGKEFLSDLVPLCGPCHARVHEHSQTGVPLERAHIELREQTCAAVVSL